MWLFLLFLIVPLIEIALFIEVGGAIGLWPTLAIVVATAALGTVLVRGQGAMALGDIRRSLNELRDPTEPLAHGAMILFSGALLLTPGFFTDAVGFALLVPPVRRRLLREARRRIRVRTGDPDRRTSQRSPGARPDVIEGDFTIDNHDPPHEDHRRDGSSGWRRD